MTRSQLNRAVARATGESLKEIRRRGFSLADPADADFDPAPDLRLPQSVNWDRVDAQRFGLFPCRQVFQIEGPDDLIGGDGACRFDRWNSRYRPRSL